MKDLPTFRGLQPPENILFDVIDGSFLRYHFRLLNAQEEESTVSTQNVAYVKNILLFSLSNNWCRINSKMPNAYCQKNGVLHEMQDFAWYSWGVY